MTGRRRFLRVVGATGVAGLLAGCTSDGDGTPADGGDGDGPGGTDSEEDTPEPSPTPGDTGTTATTAEDDGTATPTERGPRALGEVHAHGSIEVRIVGERVDLSKRKYQLQDRYFHLEAGDGRIWHLHGKGVTLRYAMDTLGIEVTDGSVRFDGTTYRDDDPEYAVSITVGGKDVDPSEYVLEGSRETPPARETSSGSHVRVVVDRQ